jgi:hypothetical protein
MGVVHADGNGERYGLSFFGPYLDSMTGSLFNYARGL